MLKQIIFDGPMFFMSVCSPLLMLALNSDEEREKKNKRLPKRFLWFFVLLFLLLALDYRFVDFNNASTSLEAPMCALAAFFYGNMALGMKRKTAFYTMVWAHLITEICTQIVMPNSDRLNFASQKWAPYVYKTFLYAAALVIVYHIVHDYVAAKLRVKGHLHVGRQKLILSACILVMYMIISNYQFIFWLLGYEPEEGSNMITMFRLVLAVMSIVFLMVQSNVEIQQRTESELNMIRQLLEQQSNQYRMSTENIRLINQKCHDLKHQMAALRAMNSDREVTEQLQEMEKAVMIYDSAVKTGNVALDTVLTEKSLYCQQHGINMTCMADGSRLGFIGNVDLYAMFGNSLDNAIESVMAYEEEEKRVIQVAVYAEKNLQMIRVRNYCDRKMEFQDGLPKSTKGDERYHGFGLKSIRYTAEKYGGGIHCKADGASFTLQILLPIPEGWRDKKQEEA